MSYIAESCPLTKLNGGLSRLHSVDEDAVPWLTSRGITVVCTNRSRVSNTSRVANISGVNTILRSRYQIHVQVLDDVHATNSLARTYNFYVC